MQFRFSFIRNLCYSRVFVLRELCLFTFTFLFRLGQLKEEFSKTARGAADSISESGSKIGKTGAFRTISETAQAVKKEIDQSTFDGNVYHAPTKLRKRVDISAKAADITPNEDATGVELHKDSK